MICIWSSVFGWFGRSPSAAFQREQMLYPPGYGFPVPFGWWHSLLGPSRAHWRRRKPTSLGLPRFTLMRCDWRRCALYSGVGCLATGQLSVPVPDPVLPSSLATIPATSVHEASSSVHSRSPIQSFPNLACADGSHAPSALPRASYPAVTSNARRDREQAMRHVPESLSASSSSFPRALADHSSSATSCRTTNNTVSFLKLGISPTVFPIYRCAAADAQSVRRSMAASFLNLPKPHLVLIFCNQSI